MPTPYVIRLTEALREKTGLQGLTPEIVEIAIKQAKGEKPAKEEEE